MTALSALFSSTFYCFSLLLNSSNTALSLVTVPSPFFSRASRTQPINQFAIHTKNKKTLSKMLNFFQRSLCLLYHPDFKQRFELHLNFFYLLMLCIQLTILALFSGEYKRQIRQLHWTVLRGTIAAFSLFLFQMNSSSSWLIRSLHMCCFGLAISV